MLITETYYRFNGFIYFNFLVLTHSVLHGVFLWSALNFRIRLSYFWSFSIQCNIFEAISHLFSEFHYNLYLLISIQSLKSMKWLMPTLDDQMKTIIFFECKSHLGLWFSMSSIFSYYADIFLLITLIIFSSRVTMRWKKLNHEDYK